MHQHRGEEYRSVFNSGPAKPETCRAPKRTAYDDGFRPDAAKVHICMLLPWAVTGGADRFNIDLLAGLDKQRFYTAALTTLPSDNNWLPRLKEAADEAYALPSFLSPDDYAPFIAWFIESRHIDVLMVTNTYAGYALIPWLRSQFPSLAVVDYVHSEEWYWRSGGNARYSSVYAPFIDKTYTCNNATKGTLIEHFGKSPDDVETVYVGVDAGHYTPENTAPGQMKAQLGIAENRPVVLYPCRLTLEKRPFLMLAIAAEMKNRRPDVAFVVAGDGLALDSLTRQAEETSLNNVFFAGMQQEMRPFYRDADVTLICSLREGLALTAYESMAMETPVVTCDVGGMTELVTPETGASVPLYGGEVEGFGATEYPQEEVAAYTDAILALLDNPNYPTLAHACRRRVLEAGFSTTAMAARFAQEFDGLASPQAAHARARGNHGSSFTRLWEEMAVMNSELLKHESLCANTRPRLKEAEDELARIHAMRSYHLLEKYVQIRNTFTPRHLLDRFTRKPGHGKADADTQA